MSKYLISQNTKVIKISTILSDHLHRHSIRLAGFPSPTNICSAVTRREWYSAVSHTMPYDKPTTVV